MTHITGHDRSQTLLLPESLDDYVGPENPVRFIEAFVDGLDLAAAGVARVQSNETGRNVEVIWLLRHLTPDFKTIADFRRDNRNAFRPVFRQFVLLCRQLDLFGRELLAIDGTRIKAVHNKDRNFTRTSLRQYIDAADKRLADYLRRLDEGDVAEGGTSGGSRVHNLSEKIEAIRGQRVRLHALLTELERTGESQISLTDPDSR